MRITILALIRVHRRERTVRENGGDGKVAKLATLDPSMRLLLCVAVSLCSPVATENICYISLTHDHGTIFKIIATSLSTYSPFLIFCQLKLEAICILGLNWKYLVRFSVHGAFRCAGTYITVPPEYIRHW